MVDWQHATDRPRVAMERRGRNAARPGSLVHYRVPLPEALRLTADGMSDSLYCGAMPQAGRSSGGRHIADNVARSLANVAAVDRAARALGRATRNAGRRLALGGRDDRKPPEGREPALLAQIVPPLVFVIVGVLVASTFVSLFLPMISLIQGLS